MRTFVRMLAVTALLAISTSTNSAGVAVIDTGVSPGLVEGLEPFMMPGGRDFVNNTPGAPDDHGHGTAVATVIAATTLTIQENLQVQNMLQILPVKVLNSQGVMPSIEVGAQGVAFAGTDPRIRIINLSLGAFANVYDPGLAQLFQEVAGRGKMIVMAAGNTGGPGPVTPAALVLVLGGWGIAVGAVDPNTGEIQPYSNRAGETMDHYLVAPDFPDIGLIGTSFSAPVVAGVASLVVDNAPHLSGVQVADILCRSARDLGAPGRDPIYGCGLVNPVAALSPIGALSVPTAADTIGGSVLLTPAALQVSPAVGYAIIQNSRYLNRLVALDEYKRAYPVVLGNMVRINGTPPRLHNAFTSLDGDDGLGDVLATGRSRLRMGYLPGSSASLAAYPGNAAFEDDRYDVTPQLSFETEFHAGLSYRMDYNMAAEAIYGFAGSNERGERAFLSAFGQPYLGFADTAHSMALTYRFGDNAAVRFGIVETDEAQSYGLDSTAAVVQGSLHVSDRTDLQLQISNLAESGSLLGGSSGGALGVDNAETVSLGLSARYRLGANTSLVGHYAYGVSEVDDSTNSLLGDFSSLRHESYGIALLTDDVLRRGDDFGIALSRPIRITDGAVTLTTPYARDVEGNVYRHTERVSLAPRGEEIDVEVFYRFNVGSQTRIGLHAQYRDEPYHNPAIGGEHTVLAVVRRAF